MKRKTFHKKLYVLISSLILLILLCPITFANTPSSLTNNSTTSLVNRHDIHLVENHRLPKGYTDTNIPKNTSTCPQHTKQIQPQKPTMAGKNADVSPWPMYCHDTKHTGLSPYNTMNNPMTVKWRYTLTGVSYNCAPVLDKNGTIYVGRNHIYAIYPNGTLKWEFIYGKPVQGCPAIDEQRGVLYYGIVWDSPNYIYALYLANGSTKWKYLAHGDVTSSPNIDSEGNIYFGDWNGDVHAVYPNGTRKWMYHTGDVITSSPAIGDDGTIYIGSHDDYVYAFYPNGTLKWRFQTGSWVHASPTIGPDGTVYIGSDDNYLYALNPNNGSMIWRCSIGGTWCSPTLGPDGTLYLGTWRMIFYAIRPNGTIKWTYNAPGRIWEGASAALSADGILYFGTTWFDGGVGAFIALDAADGQQRFIDYYGWYETSPAIAEDGTVYAVTSDKAGDYGILHAFGLGEPKKILVEQPKQGHAYIFNQDYGQTFFGNTFVIDSVTVKVKAWSEHEIDHIDFYAGYWSAEQYLLELKFTDSESPFEWTLDEYLGNNHHPLLPFDKCRIQVIGYYKGGCTWVDEVNKFWYLHLRHI